MKEFEIISPKTFNECYNWFLLNSDKKTECFIECKRGKPQDGVFHYLDAVYCALCFGWIDSVCKKINGKVVQRFSPRRKNSPWTELNKERCKWLEKRSKMTEKGRQTLQKCKEEFKISQRMMEVVNSDEHVKKHFYSFPKLYQRLRIDSIQRHFPYKNRKEMYEKQIENFIKQTKSGKMYGNLSDYGRLF